MWLFRARAALQEKRIRGAALDVTETEPLPQDSPLWDLDNVLLSPHCADRTATFQVLRFWQHCLACPCSCMPCAMSALQACKEPCSDVRGQGAQTALFLRGSVCAQVEALEQFLTILDGYVKGEPLVNIVDKESGY